MSKEPSMEEILSSIKRIIAEDAEKAATHRLNRGRSAARAETSSRDTDREIHRKAVIATMAGEAIGAGEIMDAGIGGVIDIAEDHTDSQVFAEEILELTDSLPHDVPVQKGDEASVASTPTSNAEQIGNIVDDVTHPDASAPAAAPVNEDQPQDHIVSVESETAARSSLAALSHMMVKPAGNGESATLEDLVRDMLRPMLKEWLDTNLPNMVEGMVAKEIARITGRPL